jgi:hypothetical protein
MDLFARICLHDGFVYAIDWYTLCQALALLFCFLRSVSFVLFTQWICLRDGFVYTMDLFTRWVGTRCAKPRAPVLFPSFCFLSGLPALDIIRV